MIFTDESTKSVVLAIKGTDNKNVKLYIQSSISNYLILWLKKQGYFLYFQGFWMKMQSKLTSAI